MPFPMIFHGEENLSSSYLFLLIIINNLYNEIGGLKNEQSNFKTISESAFELEDSPTFQTRL